MKILQFIASSGYVGAERSFVELCNELSKHVEVYVLVFDTCEFKDKFTKDIKFFTVKKRSRYNPFLYLSILKIIKSLKPDVIHAHSVKATEIIYNLSSFINIPFCGTKRNSRSAKVFDKIQNPIAISKETGNTIKNSNVKIIHNGIYKKDFDKTISTKKTFRIVALGRLEKIKGFDILIKEVSLLPFEFELLIAGDGAEKENLLKQIDKLNLSSKIKLIGFRNDIENFLSDSDLLIVTSPPLTDGFCRVILEGVYYSPVVISTDVGVANEILSKELIIDYDNFHKKIQDIYENYQSYLNLMSDIKKQVGDNFTPRTVASKHLEYYKKILA